MATARSLISSCTPLAKPRYTRMGAIPAMVFMLFARPLPANTRRPAASCTSTHESAEKLRRRRARPTPAVASASWEAVVCESEPAAVDDVAVGSAAAAIDDDAGVGEVV